MLSSCVSLVTIYPHKHSVNSRPRATALIRATRLPSPAEHNLAFYFDWLTRYVVPTANSSLTLVICSSDLYVIELGYVKLYTSRATFIRTTSIMNTTKRVNIDDC